MNRVFLFVFPFLLSLPVWAQPDPNAAGMGDNPPERPVVNMNVTVPTNETPEGAVRLLMWGASQGEEIFLGKSVAGAKVGFYGTNEWIEASRALVGGEIGDGVGTKARFDVKITDDRATASVVGTGWEDQLQLRREVKIDNQAGLATFSGGWRVVPPSIEDVLTKPLSDLPPLQLAAVLATRDPRLLPLIRHQGGLTQLKKLGLGVIRFTQDHNEFYAFNEAGLERALRPYVRNIDPLLFVAGTTTKWRFNDNLSTVALAQLDEPICTVLFYDGTSPNSDQLNFRGDKTLIGFADGHCAALTKDELKNLIWKP